MNAFDIRNKYCMDVSLATPTAIKIDPNMVSAVLKGVSAKKTIAIPRDFIEREAKYIMEWAEKDPSIVSKFKKASQLEKSQIMKKVVADYFAKFKWPVASRLQKAGLLDSVDLNDAKEKFYAGRWSRLSLLKKRVFTNLEEAKKWAMAGDPKHVVKGSVSNEYNESIWSQKYPTKDSVDVVDKSAAWGSVVFAGSDKNMPSSYKKIQERQKLERNNPAYQAAKKKWFAEMDKYMDGKIKVQPKMPRIEDFIK